MYLIISFFREKMLGLEKFVENSELQFKYLINLALNQKVTWTNLKTFLSDLTPTHQTTKKLKMT